MSEVCNTEFLFLMQVVQLPFTHELITVIDPSSRITRPSLFSGLGSEVVAEQYVFVDSEILSMMEMSAVSRRDKDDDELGISVLKSTTSSPRALSDEWELSSVESIDLEKEFPGVDRRTLLLLLSD